LINQPNKSGAKRKLVVSHHIVLLLFLFNKFFLCMDISRPSSSSSGLVVVSSENVELNERRIFNIFNIDACTIHFLFCLCVVLVGERHRRFCVRCDLILEITDA
ncbi:hypothetical protein T11_356, partial [Trichinella zimbabwensis]